MSDQYLAGSCNIGKSEIRRRQIVALAGLVMFITSLIGLLAKDADRSARLTLFIPLMIFAIGFVQSRKKFCLAYGLMGTFNFGGMGSISKVADPIAKQADRKTATVILLQSLALAAALTLITYALPI